jgi:hypothetical protein
MSKYELYKTAYSELYESYVSIKKVRKDANGVFIFDCTVAGEEGIKLFRKEELTAFCL